MRKCDPAVCSHGQSSPWASRPLPSPEPPGSPWDFISCVLAPCPRPSSLRDFRGCQTPTRPWHSLACERRHLSGTQAAGGVTTVHPEGPLLPQSCPSEFRRKVSLRTVGDRKRFRRPQARAGTWAQEAARADRGAGQTAALPLPLLPRRHRPCPPGVEITPCALDGARPWPCPAFPTTRRPQRFPRPRPHAPCSLEMSALYQNLEVSCTKFTDTCLSPGLSANRAAKPAVRALSCQLCPPRDLGCPGAGDSKPVALSGARVLSLSS